MNRNLVRIGLAAVTAGVVAMTTVVAAQGQSGRHHTGLTNVSTVLTGFNEDPLSLSTTGRGFFRAKIDKRDQTIDYTLTYSGLESDAAQSHLHLGGRSQSGGISVFLCSNLGNGPAGTQACPVAGGTISGTIEPVHVLGPTAQGITAGQFDELVRAIRAGFVYVNVHSAVYPGGEIRGQLR